MHVLLLVLISLLAFSPNLKTAAQTDIVPRFETAPCPRSFTRVLRCGYLLVPENRDNPDSPTIKLAVAIFPARTSIPEADPLLFFDGGPGSRTLDAWSSGIDPLVNRVNRDRDVIIFDQRGMGYSEPSLTCPEQYEADNTNWLVRCRDRWSQAGVELDAYTTRAVAADGADLMKALGIESYNVWGGSFGSSAAMTLLRDHPEGLRSVVVTALQPPQADLQADLGPMLLRTINLIGEQCAADAACSAAFPGSLSEKLAAVVARLDAQPVTLDLSGTPTEINGGMLLSGLGQILKDQPGLPLLPPLIEAFYQQQYDVVAAYVSPLNVGASDPAIPIGAYYSIRCADSILATTPAALDASLARIDPAFRDNYRTSTSRQVSECQTWGAHVPTADERLPPASEIPVLIMNGEFDPYSSPEWVESALATLPNGHAFWFPGYVHGINNHICAQRILNAFIDDPASAPDASCIDTLPPLRFHVS